MGQLFSLTLIYMAVFMVVALGAMYSERSGVTNIGLEGVMIMGALGGALVLYSVPHTVPLFVVFILALLASILLGVIYSMLLAFASINFKADQTLVGTAMNMLALAFTTIFVKTFTLSVEGKTSQQLDFTYYLNKFNLLPENSSFNISWYFILALIILVVAFVLLYKTKFGLRLMACGENPQAAASVGINVYKMRYFGVGISGILGGIGGIIYITASTGSWDATTGMSGIGFLALAVLIFGQWRPLLIAGAALIFGFFTSLSIAYLGIDWLKNLKLQSEVFKMLPYIVSLLVLVFTSKHSRAPKSAGIPYDKSLR